MNHKMIAHFEQLDEAMQGPDRVCAIVLGAAVQDALKGALGRVLLRRLDHTSKLMSFDGPFGNWGLMNDLAHAIGLISDDVWHDLDQVRQIRNKFAHWGTIADSTAQPKRVTFSTQSNKDRTSKLRCPEILLRVDFGDGGADEIVKILKLPHDEMPHLPPPSDPRERFIQTCESLLHLLLRVETGGEQVEISSWDYPALKTAHPPPDQSQ